MKTWTQFSDSELIQDARAGDYAAFEVLVDRYAGLVYGFTLRTWPDPKKAEELTLATFNRASEELDRLDQNGALATWLCGLAARIARCPQEPA